MVCYGSNEQSDGDVEFTVYCKKIMKDVKNCDLTKEDSQEIK